MSRPLRAFGTAAFGNRQSRGIPALATAAASLAAIAALTTTVRGQGCQYTISAIIQGPECGILGFPPTFGTALSDNGEVVGWYTACTIGTDEAFYWSEKTGFVTLDRPPAVYAAMATQTIVRIHVNASVTGGNEDGTSWDDAYPFLQDAIDEASTIADEDTEVHIWVAAGTYKPDDGDDHADDEPTETFNLHNNVRLYGAFAGSESDLNQRDIFFNVTVLSGLLNDPEDPEVHAYHVVSASDVDDTARIDGFTITGGDAGSGDDRATLRLAHQLDAR